MLTPIVIAVPGPIFPAAGSLSGSTPLLAVDQAGGLSLQLDTTASSADAISIYGGVIAGATSINQLTRLVELDIPGASADGRRPVFGVPPTPFPYIYILRTAGATPGLTLSVSGQETTGTVGPSPGAAILNGGNTPGPITIGTLDGTSVTLGGLSAASATTVTTGTTGALTLDSGTTGPIGIGTSFFAKSINVGSPLATVVVEAGPAGFTVGTFANGPISLTANGTGLVTLDTGSGGAIHIGTGGAPKSVIVGNTSGASGLSLLAGTGGIGIGVAAPLGSNLVIDAPGAGAIVLGPLSATSLITGAGVLATVAIRGAAGASIGIGDGALVSHVTVGNINGSSSVVLDAGSGGITMTTSTAGAISITTDTSGSIIIDSGTTGSVSIGAGAGGAKTVTVGSVTGASALSLQAGSGGFRLLNNTHTWTWPTALGAAGSKLTDAAGNGVLSWT